MLNVWGPRLSSEQHPRRAGAGWIAVAGKWWRWQVSVMQVVGSGATPASPGLVFPEWPLPSTVFPPLRGLSWSSGSPSGWLRSPTSPLPSPLPVLQASS